MSLNPIIEIQKLSTAFGEHFVHQDLNLTIYEHEILAIVGGSGSGKTTLLRAILMLQPIVSGSIKIFDQEIIHCRASVAKKLERSWGVLFQQGALFSSLTVLENVAFPLFEQTQLDKKTIYEIAKLKISLVGLSLDAINKYPAELSGGMQKRAALARAIALDPKLLFLDEPTAGLDPQGASAFDELVISFKENLGLTIVMVTHDVDTLWRVTDRVAFIGDKKVQQVGPIEELFTSPIPMVKSYFSDPRSKAARHIKEEV
jgi:phospholipid/cholesterol/gamma-HCH transport system ATP-binding protein